MVFRSFFEHCCWVIQFRTPCTLSKSKIMRGMECVYSNFMCDWMLCIASSLLLLFFLLMEPSAVQSISFPFRSLIFSSISILPMRPAQILFSIRFVRIHSIQHQISGSSSFFTYIFRYTLPYFYGKYTMPNFRNPNKWCQLGAFWEMVKGMNLCHCGFILSQQRRINGTVQMLKSRIEKLAINKMLIQL